jgi:hypothetical protein
LRYKIALSILGGDIIWINNSFLPGLINDLGIFKNNGIKDELDENERVQADDGYIGEDLQFVRSQSGPVHPTLF